MTLRHLAAGVIALASLTACGKSGTPCSGTTCLQVAGTYALTITQSSASTCKFITYNTDNGAEAVITQSGSTLTLQFSNSPVQGNETGTLNTNGTANFTITGQATVISTDGSSSQYDDGQTLDLTFTPAGGGMMNITGETSDSLNAIMPNPSGDPDPACFLEGSISGSD